MILPQDQEDKFMEILAFRKLDCFSLYRICRQCFRFCRHKLAAKISSALCDVTAGYVGFEYQVYFKNLHQIGMGFKIF